MRALVLLWSFAASAAPAVQKMSLVTSAGPIGTLSVTTRGNAVDVDWRVDDNGRGAKIKEHVELGPDRLPVKWDLEGKGWVGAPVKESFWIENGRAKWRSLDDEGEADGKGALYAVNNGSPWAFGLYLDTLLNSKGLERALVPGGRIRLEKLREVPLSDAPKADKATAWALWGWDTTPSLLLQVKGKFGGFISPGWVLVDEKHAGAFAHLSKLAGQLSAELLVFTAVGVEPFAPHAEVVTKPLAPPPQR